MCQFCHQVEALIHQVAEENGLEMIEQMEAVQPGTSSLRESGERSQEKEDQLSRRYFLDKKICKQFLSYLFSFALLLMAQVKELL